MDIEERSEKDILLENLSIIMNIKKVSIPEISFFILGFLFKDLGE